jgi:hypothetical protein
MPHKTQHTKSATTTKRHQQVCSGLIVWFGLLLGLMLLSVDVTATVELRGLYRLRTQSIQVQGNSGQYKSDTSLSAGNLIKNQLVLNAQGTLGQGWRLVGRLNTALSVSDGFHLQLQKVGTELFIGTRAIESHAIGLLAWSRLLTGVQLIANSEKQRLGLQLAAGMPLGIPAVLQLSGVGRSGPYLLPAQHLPLVSRSERIYVDGMLMQPKLDYEIDYELGSITFTMPVPIGTPISIEYEYEAAQPRLTTVLLGAWQEERMRVDFVVGQEREWAALKLGYPAGTPLWPDAIAERQHMLGVGVEWRQSQHLWLTGSWLVTTAATQVAAAHIGGHWQSEHGRAGWDYRVIPTGFAPLGAAPTGRGYKELSAGYDVRLTPHWYSKLNLLRHTYLPITGVDSAVVEQKAEHVLTYVHGHHTLGWLVGVAGQQEAGASHHAVSTGVLTTSRWGVWEIEAEQRLFLRNAAPRPGDALSRSRLALTLAEDASYQGQLQWKQESRLPVDLTGKDFLQTWQLIIASGSKVMQGATTLGDEPYWQLQGLYNTVWQENQPDVYDNNRVGYLKAHASLPLIPQLTGQVWGEWRQQSDTIDSSASYAVETALRYQRLVQSSMYAWLQNHSSIPLPHQIQAAVGLQVDIPLHAPWTYVGALDVAEESMTELTDRGWRQMHSLIWRRKPWQISAEWTQGLLELPLRPSLAAEEEQYTPVLLRELPRGRRLGIRTAFISDTTQADLYVTRDWEGVAKSWRIEGQVVTKVGKNNLKAYVSHKQRRTAQDWSTHGSAVVVMQWVLNRQMEMELKGQGDWRKSATGLDDYRAVGVFSDWTVRF